MLDILLIILFTIVYAYICWWKLDWAIVLAILFLPAYLLRFELGFLPMTILEVMVLLVFIVWLIKVFYGQQRSFKESCRSIYWPWKWLTLLFVLVGLVAVMLSPDTRQALGLWKAYILEPIIFFVVFVNVVKTKKQLTQVMWAMGASVILIGYGAMLQYLNIFDIPAHYGLETPRRATSIFPFPTAIGKYFAPIISLFLGFVLLAGFNKGKSLWEFIKRNIYTLGVLLFGVMGLLFSVSRGAIIGILAATLFISFFSKWKKWIWLGLGILIIVAMIIPQTRDNITSVFRADDVSTDVRLVMWKGAVEIIKDNPVAGTGLASFPVVYDDYKEASHTEYFPNPDHLILSLWIELGLAGLVIFGWLIVSYFKSAISFFKREKYYAVGLMAAMVAIIIHGFLDTPYFKNDLAIMFWVLVGMVVVLKKIKIDSENVT